MKSKKKKNIRPAASSSPWIGQPVAVLLKDGRSFIGMMEQMNQHEVTLSSMNRGQSHPARKKSRSKKRTKKGDKKVQVSGFLGALAAFPFGALTGMQKALNAAASLYGGRKPSVAASAGPAVPVGTAAPTAPVGASISNEAGSNSGINGNGQLGMLGFLNGIMPHMKIGLDLVKSIVPIVNMFKV